MRISAVGVVDWIRQRVEADNGGSRGANYQAQGIGQFRVMVQILK